MKKGTHSDLSTTIFVWQTQHLCTRNLFSGATFSIHEKMFSTINFRRCCMASKYYHHTQHFHKAQPTFLCWKYNRSQTLLLSISPEAWKMGGRMIFAFVWWLFDKFLSKNMSQITIELHSTGKELSLRLVVSTARGHVSNQAISHLLFIDEWIWKSLETFYAFSQR